MPHKTMQTLLDGHAMFEAEVFERDKDRFHNLAELGQSPKVLLIGCCDSRVDPVQIFQAKPGELFVARNVGAIVPPYNPDGTGRGTSAAIEFAVKALGVEAVVILGHTNCGAVQYCHERVHHKHDDVESDFEFLPAWVDLAEQADEEPEPDVQAFGARMLKRSLENLAGFPFIKERLDKDELVIDALRFNIHTGKLEHIS